MSDSKEAVAPPSKPRTWRRRLRSLLLTVVFTLVLFEVICRAYWAIDVKISPLDTAGILYKFYPTLHASGLMDRTITTDDDTYDVLLLGGSVLNKDFGDIGEQFGAALEQKLGQTVKVYNLASKGHTSRDSLIKYQQLEDDRFDLVFVYHAINEARFNVCPGDLFDEQYRHVAWYDKIEALRGDRYLPWWVTPFTLKFLVKQGAERAEAEHYIPDDQPREDWLDHGSSIKTAKTFAANLRAIADTAKARGDRLVFASFATYVPNDYSLEAFKAKTLDYANGGRSPIEIWGKVEHVLATVAAHNQAAQDVAQAAGHVLFVDLASAIPDGGAFYQDICHLTAEGSKRFAQRLATVVMQPPD